MFSAGALSLVRELGLAPLLWSRWGRDWGKRETPELIERRATRELSAGDVVLLHDADHYSAPGSWSRTAAALPSVLATVGDERLHVRRREPRRVAADAFLERRQRLPAELAPGSRARDLGAMQVGRPARHVHDRDVRDEPAHDVGDLAHAHGLVADEVVGAAGGMRHERGHDALGQVLDVHELARLGPVSHDPERETVECAPHERRDDRRLARAGPVRDPEAEDRRLEAVELLVGAAVHLARELRRRVEVVGRRKQRVLVQQLRRRAVAVHPDRAARR